MGNQCCQGNSPGEDKNTISMGNKDFNVNSVQGSTKNVHNDKEKPREEESTRQLKEKYGKSIVSHNSKQDYQDGDDRLVGSQTNNVAYEEQASNHDKAIDKQTSHQYGSSQREIQGKEEAQKQSSKTGSQLNLKGQQAATSTTTNTKSTSAETHVSESNGVTKDGFKESSNNGSAQPIAKQSSSNGKQPAQGQKEQKSSSGDQQPAQSSKNGLQRLSNAGLPPAPNANQAKQKKESQSVDAKKPAEDDKSKKSSPSISKSPQRPPAKNSVVDFNISADSFIHLKKGTITQQYKIGEVLGEGAFGQVSKVVHKNTGMVRAMKTIKKSSIIKEEEDRLFSEMNILKNLDHPNILRLIELFQDNKNYYLVTEYCSGGELFDKIKSMTHFTEKMAADYMKQILSAVVYCHQNNIVHRDLKPENLLFDSDKKNANLKVIDFGTSRKYDKQKKMSKRLGTPYYIAPEVLDQNYDEKCDVWSCGVILYILLCGYPPFGGRSEDEILKKVRLGKFKFEPEDWDRISEEAKNLIKKMLTYDPKKRLTAEQALNDAWIQKNAPANHISTRALSNLSSFYTRSKLKQAILTFIVSQVVSQQDKEELQKTFRSLDKNGDGTLSKEELIDGYTTVLGDKEKAATQVDRILDEVDINKSGKVDFTEFLMAASNKEILLSKAKVEQSFKIFDQDGNGNITKDELQYIMGDIPDEFWKQILEECDTNKDGMISQTEFIDLLINKKGMPSQH